MDDDKTNEKIKINKQKKKAQKIQSDKKVIIDKIF